MNTTLRWAEFGYLIRIFFKFLLKFPGADFFIKAFFLFTLFFQTFKFFFLKIRLNEMNARSDKALSFSAIMKPRMCTNFIRSIFSKSQLRILDE